jgi:hypothetical protein
MKKLDPTFDDIAKLPKWGQAYIETLLQKIDKLQDSLDAQSNPDSPVTWWLGIDGGYHGLPQRAIITMRLDQNKKVEISIRDNQVKVRGSAGLIIYPDGTMNAIALSVKDSMKK